jgi:hypothetical protein
MTRGEVKRQIAILQSQIIELEQSLVEPKNDDSSDFLSAALTRAEESFLAMVVTGYHGVAGKFSGYERNMLKVLYRKLGATCVLHLVAMAYEQKAVGLLSCTDITYVDPRAAMLKARYAA